MNPLADPNLTAVWTGAVRLVVPEIVLVGTACLLFLLGLFARRRWVNGFVALAGLLAAAAVTVVVRGAEQQAFADLTAKQLFAFAPIDPGHGAEFVRWVALAAGLLFVLVGWKEVTGQTAGDYFACLLVVVAGASLVGRANDLVSLFLALEMVSIPTYVLLYLPARDRPGLEAAAKYFLLSVLSSAVTLLGFSYLYGLAGTTNLVGVIETLTDAHAVAASPLAVLAAVLVTAGIGFRLAAVPFHFYAPDVYQGGPTGVVAQLAFVPKLAGFVALARLSHMLFPDAAALPFGTATQYPLMLWVLAALTMTVGNVLALLQDNLKRLLAYSGVAHGGYMLIGLVAASSLPDAGGVPYLSGVDAVLFYLVAYGLMTVGAFAVIAHLHAADRPVESVDDLAGVGQTNPTAALTMAVLLLSLIGLPLTAGFVGKLMLFLAAFQAPTDSPMGNLYRVLAVVAAVNAAVGAVYYLRLLGVMYLRSPLRPVGRTRGRAAAAAGVLCAAGTVLLGVYPQPLKDAARAAVPAASAKPAGPAVAAAAR